VGFGNGRKHPIVPDEYYFWLIDGEYYAKRPRTEPVDLEGDWIWTGDQRMFAVGRTPGGAPYGWVEDQCHVA
jgi:hypothetical protein